MLHYRKVLGQVILFIIDLYSEFPLTEVPLYTVRVMREAKKVGSQFHDLNPPACLLAS